MIVVVFNSESTYIRLIKEEMFLLCFLVTHIFFLESTNVETIELSWYFPGIDLYFVHLNLSKQQI